MIIIGVCLGVVVIAQTKVTLIELLNMLSEKGETGHHLGANIRGNTNDQYHGVDHMIAESLTRVADMTFPDYMGIYVTYDTSAKRALLDLRASLRSKRVQLPLFSNLLEAVNPNPPKICLSIATARRKGSPFSYLVQSVSALLNRMNYAKYNNDVYIHVFNVDSEPENHEEVGWIKDLVPVTNVKVYIPPIDNFQIVPEIHESLDTAYIIREFYRIGCEYPILIEDDALATTNSMDSVMDAIKELHEDPYMKIDWLGVRLFVARQEYPELESHGVNDYDQHFSMVAVLLNRKHMLPYADAMEKNVNITLLAKNPDLHSPKDLIIDHYRNQNGLKILAYEPVIFQHIGLYSSVITRRIDESSVNTWYMYSKYFQASGEPILFQEDFW
jgi:hypothetical protein